MALLDSLHVEADGRYGAVSRVVSLVLTGRHDGVVAESRVFIDGDLLDCEFAALQIIVLAQLHKPSIGRCLTARTRSREVFPAF